MLREPRARIKRHDYKLHVRIGCDIHIDDAPLLIGKQIAEPEYLTCLDLFVHSNILSRNHFRINESLFRSHAAERIFSDQHRSPRCERAKSLLLLHRVAKPELAAPEIAEIEHILRIALCADIRVAAE